MLNSRALLGIVVAITMMLMVVTASDAQTNVTVNGSATYQTMDGFGGEDWVSGESLTPSQADLFFSPTSGIGLEILRTGNYACPTTGGCSVSTSNVPDLTTIQEAVARGAQVELSIQSPPADLKYSGSFTDGTYGASGACLATTNFSAYATFTVQWIQMLNANAGTVTYLDVANEAQDNDVPTSGLGACDWSASTLDTYIGTYLGPALSSAGLSSVKIVMPSSSGWFGTVADISSTCLNDPTCAQYVARVSAHGYGNGSYFNTGFCCAAATNPGSPTTSKPIWMSEVMGGWNYDSTANLWTWDPSMSDALEWAQYINDMLVTPQVSGWLYWELADASESGTSYNDGLTDANFTTGSRYYVVGNYSKFVRQGYVRIGATANPTGGVYVTAFENPSSGNIAIIAINQNGSSVDVNFTLSNLTATSVTPWITSSSYNLAAQSAVDVSGGVFGYTLPAESVTTFVSTGGSIGGGSNLLTNPSWSTGSLSPWTTSGSSSDAYVQAGSVSPGSYDGEPYDLGMWDGSNSYQVSVYQCFSGQPAGSGFTASAYAYTGSTTTGQAVYAQDGPGGATLCSTTVPAGNGSWTQYSCSGTVPSDGNLCMNLGGGSEPAGAWMDWDNASLTDGSSGGEGPYGGTPAPIPGTLMAENYDTGGQGVGYSVSSVNGTDNSYRSDGVDLETATSPATGNDLGWTASGQWFRYTVNVASAGTYTITFEVASPSGVTDGFHLSNSSGTNLSGSVDVPNTGGWQNWTTVTASVTLPAGEQTLTLDQDNSGWNIDSMAFASGGGCTPSASGTTIPSASQITDGSCVVWTVSGGASYENGTADGGYDISLLLYYNSNIYADTNSTGWYEHSPSSGWYQVSGDPRGGGGGNLLSNPSFASGSLSSWTPWIGTGSSSDVYVQACGGTVSCISGTSYWLGMSDSSSDYYVSAYQVITGQPVGASFTASVWAYTGPGANGLLNVQNANGAELCYTSVPANNGAWTQYTCTGNVDSTGTLNFSVVSGNTNPANSWLVWDNASLTD